MPLSCRPFLALLVCAAALGVVASVPAAAVSGSDRTDAEAAVLDPEAAPLFALPLGEAPGATTVITAREIERSGAANIFDLLRRVPGVDIRYTPMGGHIGIRSTGFSPFSEQVLMLIDGSPYNSPDKGGFPGHPNYTGFFPLDQIARIEIIKGPVSVLYGANAYGGVVNIVSRKAADSVTEQVEGTAYGATVLAGGRRTLERRVRAALVKGGWDATFVAGAADGDTPIRLNGDADHSRADVYAGVRRGAFWASALHQESRNGSFSFIGNPTRTAYQSVDIVDAHYGARAGGFVLRGSATLNRYRGTTCANCHNNQTRHPDDAKTSEVGDVREVDQRVRLAARADRTLTDSQDLNLGVEAALDTIRRRIVRIDDSPSDLGSAGLFAQHQWHLRGRSLHLLTGLRYDEAEALEPALSPRLALVSEPTEDVVLRASWSRAFRVPSWNERYIRQRFLPDDLFPGTVLLFQGNPDLDRERIDAAEAGIAWRARAGLVVKMDLYYNRLSDFILRGPGQLVPGTPNELRQVYMNRPGSFLLRGGELTLTALPIKHLSLTGSFAYKGTNLPLEDPAAAYAPRVRGTFIAAWEPSPRWTVDLTGSYASGYTVSSPSVFGLRSQPSYQLFDAAVRREWSAAWGRMSVGLVGRNLWDEHPTETLINEEIDTGLRGRTLAVELRVDM